MRVAAGAEAAEAAQVACSILIVANFRTRFISCPGTDSCPRCRSLPSPCYTQHTPLSDMVSRLCRLCLCLFLCLCLCLSLFIDFGRSNNVCTASGHTHTHAAVRTVTLFLIHSSGRHTASIARTNKSSGLAWLCLPWCLHLPLPASSCPACSSLLHSCAVRLLGLPCSDFSCHIFRAWPGGARGAAAARGMTKIINNSQRQRHVATCRLQRILTVPHATC